MKTTKKIATFILAAIIAAGALTPLAARAAADVRVTLNGEAVDFAGDHPTLVDNSVFVPRWFIVQLLGEDATLPAGDTLPLRATLEPLGFTLAWESA
ncbi:MAG: hypothetical protein FWG38_08950, partial [Defluviitaleaceae bacterium]|nr:hypothetical protein [Defluviitaleaceae bacterium]